MMMDRRDVLAVAGWIVGAVALPRQSCARFERTTIVEIAELAAQRSFTGMRVARIMRPVECLSASCIVPVWPEYMPPPINETWLEFARARADREFANMDRTFATLGSVMPWDEFVSSALSNPVPSERVIRHA